MKQVININFQGRVVPIEVTAFELLKNYTESLNKHFANEEGKDEIINDIESRIGELFQERLKNGATCITDDDVNAIIKSMGRPEEFSDIEDSNNVKSTGTGQAQNEEQKTSSTQPHYTGSRRLYRDEENKILGGVCAGIGNYFGIDAWIPRILIIITGIGFIAYFILWAFLPSSSNKVIGGARKKLYRDTDDKIIAGVCSGIGNYFGINSWIPRVLFLLPFISFAFGRGNWGNIFDFGDLMRITFSPGSLIIYIILWLVIPEALTTAEKLEMKGEKVDIDSIKNSVMEEMKGVQSRAEKFTKEATAFAASTSKKVGEEVTAVARRSRSSLGDIIALLFKIIGYTILGSIAIALIALLFVFAVASIGLFPLKDFVIRDGWQNVMAWGTLLFFVITPVIGVITFIIRRIAKSKGHSKLIRWSFAGAWTVGWICFFALLSLVGRDFSAQNRIDEEVILSNPKVGMLEISSPHADSKYYGRRWLKFEPYNNMGMNDDSVLVGNMQVRIKKSSNDSFKIVLTKISNGINNEQARGLAQKIEFDAFQTDSLLTTSRGIIINKTDKFRNQFIILTVYVPVDKKIKIGKNFGWWNNVQIDGPFINGHDLDPYWNEDYDAWEHGWDKGVTYVMKADGLYTLDGYHADEWKRKNTKVKIGPGSIKVKDGNTEININSSGITVEDGEQDNYRYDNDTRPTILDSLNEKQSREKQRLKDSLEKVIQRNEAETERLKQLKEKVGGGNLSPEIPLFIPMPKFFVIDPVNTLI